MRAAEHCLFARARKLEQRADTRRHVDDRVHQVLVWRREADGVWRIAVEAFLPLEAVKWRYRVAEDALRGRFTVKTVCVCSDVAVIAPRCAFAISFAI